MKANGHSEGKQLKVQQELTNFEDVENAVEIYHETDNEDEDDFVEELEQ